MSGSLNKVILIGNLGGDPEMKVTPSGKPFARFSVATTETWRTPAGEQQKKTEWHKIVAWNKQAEMAEKYLRKGKQVMIEGRIQYSDYVDSSGVKKFYTDILCDKFVMLGRMDDSPRQGQGGGSYERPPAASASGQDYEESTPPPAQGGYDDDIPF